MDICDKLKWKKPQTQSWLSSINNYPSKDFCSANISMWKWGLDWNTDKYFLVLLFNAKDPQHCQKRGTDPILKTLAVSEEPHYVRLQPMSNKEQSSLDQREHPFTLDCLIVDMGNTFWENYYSVRPLMTFYKECWV